MKKLIKESLVLLVSLFLIFGMVWLIDFGAHREDYFEDRGDWVRKDVSKEFVITLPEDAGIPLFSAVVPVGSFGAQYPAEKQVLLIRTEQEVIVFSIDGRFLTRDTADMCGGVYYDGGQYHCCPIISSCAGICYQTTQPLLLRYGVLEFRNGMEVALSCEGGLCRNYKTQHLSGGQIKLTKTYEYKWQKDVHFIPFVRFASVI